MKSGDSLNGTCRFCRIPYESLHSLNACRDSVKRRFCSLISASSRPLPQTSVSLCVACFTSCFSLRGSGKPPGRKSPKNGEKLQNSPPQSDPRNLGKIQKNCKFCFLQSAFNPPLFSINFPIFGGRTGEGNFVIFPIFGNFRLDPLRGKTTRSARCKEASLF